MSLINNFNNNEGNNVTEQNLVENTVQENQTSEENQNETQENNTQEDINQEEESIPETTEEMIKDKYKIRAKANTGFASYYRKGLKFNQCFREFEVSKEIYEALKKDNHLIIEDIN